MTSLPDVVDSALERDAPILIVDDYAGNLVALEALLAPLKQPIVRAASGDEALRYLLDGECAVVLMDLTMPGMSGIETATVIRERPRTARIPIIFLTASDPDPKTVGDAYERGAVDFIIKPADPKILLSKVSVFVELHRWRRLATQRAHGLVRTIVAGMPDGVVAHDDLGRLLYANDAAARASGFATAAELLASAPGMTRVRIDVEDETGRPIPATLMPGPLVAAGATAIRSVVKIRDKETREERWYEVSAQPVVAIDSDTRLAVSSFHDVTTERWARERERFLADAFLALASSLDYEQTLRKITTLAVPRLADCCAVDMKRDDGSYEQLAVAQIDSTQSNLVEELRRRSPLDPSTPLGVSKVIQTGQSELLASVPERRLHSAMIVPIVTSRGTVGAISLITAESARRYTVEDLRLAEQLGTRAGLAVENALLYGAVQAAVRARDEFLSIASHELRTPLTSIQLHVDMLTRKLKGPQLSSDQLQKSQERVQEIGVQLDALNQLIEQLLDVSRISERRVELRPETTDAVPLVRAVLASLAPQAERARCAVSISAPATLRGTWDPTRFSEIVANLVGNALKYGKGAAVEVTLEERDSLVRLVVHDHGLGISAQDQARIFDRFERAVPSRHYGGLGLGLWIVKQIVDAHGGQIWVRSREGEGATFIVELPRNPPSNDSRNPEP